MSSYPTSLREFQKFFPDEAACAAYLAALKWPGGFCCPACGHDQAWALETKAWTYECKRCGRQTSLKAGAIMHDSKLPLTTWFWAAWLMATRSNGMAALQLMKQLGPGSYKTAWLLCRKLRRAMRDPQRNPLSGLVEIDETAIPFRTRDEPVAGGQGRSHAGKIAVIGAVGVNKGRPGRIRLAPIAGSTETASEESAHGEFRAGASRRSCHHSTPRKKLGRCYFDQYSP